MTAVNRLITPAGSNMLCAVSTAEERQACPVTEFGFCVGVVLAWAAGARTVHVVDLTLYEMECVKPVNPTVSTMFIFSDSRDFPLYFWWFIFNFGCIPHTSCCVRIVLYFVVLTLYEMECVKPLNPTVSTMVIFSHSRDFPLYFWWFIFNFGCIPGTLSAASRHSFTEK